MGSRLVLLSWLQNSGVVSYALSQKFTMNEMAVDIPLRGDRTGYGKNRSSGGCTTSGQPSKHGESTARCCSSNSAATVQENQPTEIFQKYRQPASYGAPAVYVVSTAHQNGYPAASIGIPAFRISRLFRQVSALFPRAIAETAILQNV